MRCCDGVWLPAGDTHMPAMIRRTPRVAGRPTYQYPKLLAALKHVRENAVAVDIGAHVGLWSYQLAQTFGRVEAFEPLELHRRCLARNLQGLANVRVHSIALGCRSGSAVMSAERANSGESWVVPDGRRGTHVPLGRLDDFGLAGVGMMKLDCEGYEYFALRGALETIERCRPVVVVEQHEASELRYCIPHLAGRDLLVRHGYVEVERLTVDHVMVPREFLSC